jgi:hypothetical protein
MTSWFNDMGKSIVTIANSIGGQITDGFNQFGKSVTSFFTSMGNEIMGGFNIIGSSMTSFFKTMGEQITSGFNSIGPSMTSSFKTLGTQASSSFNVVGSSLNTFFDDIGKQTTSGFNDALGSTTSFFDKIGKEMTKGFNDTMGSTNDFFKEVGGTITDGFDFITKWFESLAWRFIAMGRGLNNIFTGLFVDEPIGIGEGLAKGFTDIGSLMLWSGEYLFSNMMCGIKYLQNLHRCFFFYIVDMLGQILYLPIRVTLWLMKDYLKRDLYGLMDKIWGYIYQLDGYSYHYLGIHFAHYPKEIRDNCYNCRRVKVLSLQRKANQVDYSFNTGMRKRLEKGLDKMNLGASEFRSAFM